jgi:hypothetical protein
LQFLVAKERAMTEVLNSGCVMALITCLNNIKKSTKSTACIFDCLRSITRQDAAKLDFIRHEGVAAVARHLVDSFRELSKQRNIVDLEFHSNSANQCVCTFLEICNIDIARSQFANLGLHQFLREFTAVPQTGKTARLHANTGEIVTFPECVVLNVYFQRCY